MRGTTGGDRVTGGANASWRPFALGAALALALAGILAASLVPVADALRKGVMPEGSVAWLKPHADGAPVHWLEGGDAGGLHDLPRDARSVQVAMLLTHEPSGTDAMTLLLPAAAGTPAIYVNSARVLSEAQAGAPYTAATRMRPVTIAIPAYFFRPGLNRVDAVIEQAWGPVLMAPPLLGDRATLEPVAARISAVNGLLHSIAIWSCLAAALLALGASAVAERRGFFIGLAAAAAALGCRMLAAGAALPPWLAARPVLLDEMLLAAALASLACAAVNRPRIGQGSGGVAAGALGGSVVAMSLVAVHGTLRPPSGWWLPWLEAFHGSLLAALAVVLAGVSGWIFCRGTVRFANVNLNLSRAVRLQRIRIEQADLALEQQKRRAAVLEERQRLARDVHDGVGGTLASLLARIRMRRIDIGQIESELVGGLADLRLIVDSMDAAGSSLAGALAVFRSRIAPQAEASGMALRWEQSETMDDEACDPAWMLNLYRLMQEAVNNALRHSGGRHLLVSVQPLDARRLRIEVADDGAGFQAGQVTHGNGLSNMAWRARRLGAELLVGQGSIGASGGTSVVLEVELPMAGAAHPRGLINPS